MEIIFELIIEIIGGIIEFLIELVLVPNIPKLIRILILSVIFILMEILLITIIISIYIMNIIGACFILLIALVCFVLFIFLFYKIVTENKNKKISKNPWENISLFDYEEYMKYTNIEQLQTLSAIMRKQINTYPAKTIAVLGVAGGDGLEHVDKKRIEKIYGIDINQKFLNICKKRYSELGNCLKVVKADFSDKNFKLPTVNLIIANLFIEYTGIEVFIKQIEKNKPSYISCVIQKKSNIDFVSASPFVNSFTEISKIHLNIDKDELIEKMKTIQMELIFSEEIVLPDNKIFIRLDFQ